LCEFSRLRPEVGKLCPHSMLNPKVVGEDYVDDHRFECAMDGREGSKVHRNLPCLIRSERNQSSGALNHPKMMAIDPPIPTMAARATFN
jgi:hypothetical protein